MVISEPEGGFVLTESRPEGGLGQRQTIGRLPPGHVRVMGEFFRLALKAQRKSPRTVKSYLEAVGLLAAFLREHGMPEEVAALRREHVEAFIVDQVETRKPA